MQNVEMKREGDRLTITIDLSKDFGPSKSGKSTTVATTAGNATVPGTNVKVGLNVYRPRA